MTSGSDTMASLSVAPFVMCVITASFARKHV